MSQTLIAVNRELKNERFANAPLSLAVYERDREGFQKLLTSDQIDVNAQSADGFTALHWAAMLRFEDIILALIARSAASNIKNKYDRTPIDYYRYQICAADFRKSVPDTLYEEICRSLSEGSETMPEFNECFFNAPMKIIGASVRNKKPINMTLFETNMFNESKALTK